MAGKQNWERIRRLNGGEPIWFIEPLINTRDEVWFFAPGPELRIHSAGVLYRPRAGAKPPAGAVTERHTLYRLADDLYVDVEVRGDRLVLRRGVLNGGSVATERPASERHFSGGVIDASSK